jgi:chemotaxis protein methyltransferase CheR
VNTVTPDDFELVRRVVHEGAAIVLEDGKEYLVESRLLPVARQRGLHSVAELVQRLRQDPAGEIRTVVVEALTTNETSFFRDGRPFQALADDILPGLIRARTTERQLTIWSAACSSGQEPYSTAIVLRDALADRAGWRTRIIASDISQAMVERTREGLYSQLEVNRGLPVQGLMQHFTREGTQWRVHEDLRAMVETRRINLAAPWPALPQMDLILLRNVMIYFDIPTKRRILANVRSLLRPGGYLLLGGAETTLNLDEHFERVSFGSMSAYRVGEGKTTA